MLSATVQIGTVQLGRKTNGESTYVWRNVQLMYNLHQGRIYHC